MAIRGRAVSRVFLIPQTSFNKYLFHVLWFSGQSKVIICTTKQYNMWNVRGSLLIVIMVLAIVIRYLSRSYSWSSHIICITSIPHVAS